MLRNGNLGLKMGVSRAAHTQYAHNYMEVVPREPQPRTVRIAVLAGCATGQGTLSSLPSPSLTWRGRKGEASSPRIKIMQIG